MEHDASAGQAALNEVAASFRQGWAAREARLELTTRQLANPKVVRDLPQAIEAFAWLSEETRFRRSQHVLVVRGHFQQAALLVDEALASPGKVNRLRQLEAAKREVQNLRAAFATMDRQTVQQFRSAADQWWDLLVEATAEEIPNPYIVGNPLQTEETDLFVGRDDMFRAIEAALYAPRGKPTLVLHGPRRVGKTTVLLHLPRLLPPEIIPAFLDAQSIGGSSEGGVYYAVADAITKAARQHRQVSLPQPELATFQAEPGIALGQWLDQVETTLDGRAILLAIDEFERLGRAIREEKLPTQILDMLRHLIQHRPRLYLLFAGVNTPDELGPRWHDYFISARLLRLSYLDEQAARRLIQRPIPDWPLRITTAAEDEILRLSRSQPYLVQLLCYELVNWFNSRDRRRQPNPREADVADVKQAANMALNSGEPYFTNVWEEAGAAGQQALALAALPEGAHLPADIPAHEIERLVRLDLLEERDGRWHIQVELIRRWLTQKQAS